MSTPAASLIAMRFRMDGLKSSVAIEIFRNSKGSTSFDALTRGERKGMMDNEG